MGIMTYTRTLELHVDLDFGRGRGRICDLAQLSLALYLSWAAQT